MTLSLSIKAEDQGKRLDVVLTRCYPDYSRAYLQKVLKQGSVTLNGKPQGRNYRVKAGEIFQIADFEVYDVIPAIRKPGSIDSPSRPTDCGTVPSDDGTRMGTLTAAGNDDKSGVPTVLFEDAALLVVNKPAGWVVHPASSYRGVTLLDWLRHHLGPAVSRRFPDPQRLGLVHRLDKDTSGVLLVAKTVLSQTALGRQFHDRQVRKTYTAFVEGTPRHRGVISAPVGRSRKQPARMAVTGTGRPSETTFEVKEAFKDVSCVQLFPKTGRTHQIRVHLAAIGHPVVGDWAYGAHLRFAEDYDIQRTLLHAEKLEVTHPVTKEPISFEAPWPEDFRRAQACFRRALKAAVLLISIGLGLAGGLRAEGAKIGGSKTSSSSEVRRMKRELSRMRDQLEQLDQRLAQMDAKVDTLKAGSEKLSSVEQALLEMNSKTVQNSNAAEEAKTQVLEAGRKLKNQQDTLDQLRDQLDRLQRDLAQLKAKAESAPAAPAPSK